MKPTTTQPISEEERARRREAIDYARNSIGLEGFTLNEASEALFARYIDGELTRPELNAAALKLAERLRG